MTFKMDFIGIGSGKCGSTWLYDNLVKHPEICDRNLKELNYFSELYERHPMRWYESQFADCEPDMKKGEFSVTYISHPEAAERIYRHFPEVKLIAILRNPVKRAFSNYLHSIRKGDILPSLSFGNYIEDENRLIPGHFADHLQRFYARFDREQIRVIITEEFAGDPLQGYHDLYQYIGVQDFRFIPPDYDKRRNVAKSYRYLWLENILVRSYRVLSKSGYTKLVKQITESGIANWIRAINRDNRPVPEIDPESQQRLLEYYRPYNQQLEDLLGRDLSIWGKSVS
ncbi:MAG: sulfotransferase domain-containing protein [Chromatiales bacterium]